MRINFVSYLNPFEYSGGGEIVNREIVNSGIARGHEFSFTTVKSKQSEYRDDFDLDFIVDIFNFPQTLKSLGAWRRMSDDILHQILLRGRFLHMSNAYADICNLGYLPCNGQSQNPCTFKEETFIKDFLIRRETTRDCFSSTGIVKQLFTKSLLNIYVSPLHQKTISNALRLDDSHRSLIVRPIIDTRQFRNLNTVRDIDYLFVGVLTEAKGFYAMRERFFSEEIFLVGSNPQNLKIDFGNYLGVVPYSDVPLLMNRAKNFVFLPRWPEPQGRVVVEAALSGCNLIVNENVGATSFPFDISEAKNIEDATGKFWQELEERVL
jgi:glycosyltransferase involved in cell wall biosynthesis